MKERTTWGFVVTKQARLHTIKTSTTLLARSSQYKGSCTAYIDCTTVITIKLPLVLYVRTAALA